jgi:hypothetical protein
MHISFSAVRIWLWFYVKFMTDLVIHVICIVLRLKELAMHCLIMGCLLEKSLTDLLEVRKQVLPTPSIITKCLPSIVVGNTTPGPTHTIDQTTTSNATTEIIRPLYTI